VIQDSISDKNDHIRVTVNRDMQSGGLLQPDNVLISRPSGWMNGTGTSIHLEPTFLLTYQLEKQP
jgi:hypothetical protein